MLASLVAILIARGSSSISEFSPFILLASAVIAVVIAVATKSVGKHDLLAGLRRNARQILPAVPLLMLIAMISATWLLSGVVPTLIDYGIRLLNPTFFLVTTCAVCALVSVLTGSSWTTIATIGVAFIGIGRIIGYDSAWIAGAIISGAYFGDKVSPLSDTTVIASSSCGVDLFDHIRYLMLTTVPAMTIALLTYLFIGLATQHDPIAPPTEIIDALRSTFNITPLLLIIPLIVAVLIALRVKTIYTLAAGTLLGIVGIFLFQPQIPAMLSGGDGGLIANAKTIFSILATETSITSGSPLLDPFLTTGGVTGMLPTIFLVLCAMIFGGVMIGTGMLATIARSFTRRLTRPRSAVSATVAGGLFLNSATADQYLSIIIGSNMYRDLYNRLNLQPRLLSRTLEDSVSVTSVLIPWNSCGVTQSTILGVATLAYLPCCIFNLMSPLMTIIMAAVGFRLSESRPATA